MHGQCALLLPGALCSRQWNASSVALLMCWSGHQINACKLIFVHQETLRRLLCGRLEGNSTCISSSYLSCLLWTLSLAILVKGVPMVLWQARAIFFTAKMFYPFVSSSRSDSIHERTLSTGTAHGPSNKATIVLQTIELLFRNLALGFLLKKEST